MRFAGGCVLLVACLVGCAGGSVRSGVEPDVASAVAAERTLWDAAEELTARCMAEHGFEYLARPAVEPDDVRFGNDPFDLTAEEAGRRGFGIVEGILESEIENGSGGDPMTTGSEDPNEGLRLTLEPAEREAWDRTLLGDDGGGCRARARAEASDRFGSELREIENDLRDRGERLEQDGRMVELWMAWSACMAGSEGVRFADLAALHADLAGRAVGLVAGDGAARPGGRTTTTSSDDERRAAIDALAEEERDLAVASVTCLEPLVDDYERIVTDLGG